MQEFFISLFNGIIGLLNDIVPDFNSDGASQVSSGIDTILDYIDKMNYFFPMKDLFIILGIIIAIMMSRFVLFLVNWVIKRIRGG